MSVKEVLEKIEFSISAVLDEHQKGHEFFATLLWSMPIVIYETEDEISGAPAIAWTDGEKVYIVAPKVKDITPAELLFILEHELLHILSDHITRGKGKDPLLWNLATDAWINKTLVDTMGIVEKNEFPGIRPPEGAFFLDTVDASKMSEEEIYNYLLKNAKVETKKFTLKLDPQSNSGQEDNQGNSCNGSCNSNRQGSNNSNQPSAGKGNDKNDGQQGGNTPEIEIEVIEVEIEGKKFRKIHADLKKGMEDAENKNTNPSANAQRLRNLARALKEAMKGRGSMPAGLEEIINKLTEVKLPWDEILEKAIRNIMVESEYRTWARPNVYLRNVAKKVGIAGLPGYGDEPTANHLVIVLDTSGSISREELQKFLYVISESLQYFKKVTRIEHDAEIQAIKEYEEYDFDELDKDFFEIHGCGGTSHKPVFDWIEEKFLEEDISLVIFLTDYYSDAEEIKDKYEWIREIPIIWIVSSSKEPSYGITVKIG